MAENEYLDSSKARRWFFVAEGIRDQVDSGELTNRVQDRLFKTLRKIRNDLPFSEMVAAVEDSNALIRVCEQFDGGRDVTDMLIQASLEHKGKVNILESFLSGALQNCLHDIPWMASDLGERVNISEARRKLDDVKLRLAPVLHWAATKLATAATWNPQKPRSASAAESKPDQTSIMLRESLIAGSPK